MHPCPYLPGPIAEFNGRLLASVRVDRDYRLQSLSFPAVDVDVNDERLVAEELANLAQS